MLQVFDVRKRESKAVNEEETSAIISDGEGKFEIKIKSTGFFLWIFDGGEGLQKFSAQAKISALT